MDYYEKLVQSDLWKGKVVAINSNGNIATAGEYITHLECVKCKRKTDQEYRESDWSNGLVCVADTNCKYCSWDSIKKKHNL